MGGTLDVRRLSPNEEPSSKVVKGRPAVSPWNKNGTALPLVIPRLFVN